jgi:protoporphyrinogen oxidase
MLPNDTEACLGLEYFVNTGDPLWKMPDDEIIEFAKSELQKIGIAQASYVTKGWVVRVPKAYPIYDATYAQSVETIRNWLSNNFPSIVPVGRNGMHRYNNQDHSMMTAILAVENISTGSKHDLWAVNVEGEYHEIAQTEGGTGRKAPVFGIRTQRKNDF